MSLFIPEECFFDFEQESPVYAWYSEKQALESGYTCWKATGTLDSVKATHVCSTEEAGRRYKAYQSDAVYVGRVLYALHDHRPENWVPRREGKSILLTNTLQCIRKAISANNTDALSKKHQ